jgi:1-acyl-sn-glycerol-3-phosphate acyltransferase
MSHSLAFLRSFVFNILFIFWTSLVVVVCIPTIIMPRFAVFGVAKYWGLGVQFLLKYCVGITYEIRGRENIPEGPAIIASKHQSAWETTMIHALVPGCAVILKRELTWIPLFGQLLLKARSITLHRSKGSRILPQLIRQAKERLNDGQKVFIFPEGTRRAVDAPPQYKSGIAMLYRESQVPVVPAAHNAGYFWARRDFIKKPGKIVFEFLPAIQPGLEGDAFMKKLTDAIESTSNSLKPSEDGSNSTRSNVESKHRQLLFLILLLLLGFGGYTVMWKNSAIRLEKSAIQLIESLRNKGMKINYNYLSVTGFPLSLKVNLKHLNIETADQSISVTIPKKLSLQASVWNLNHLKFMTKGPVIIRDNNAYLPFTGVAQILKVNGEYFLESHQDHFTLKLDKVLFARDEEHLSSPNMIVSTFDCNWTKRHLPQQSKEDPYLFDMSLKELMWQDNGSQILGSSLDFMHLKGSLNTPWPWHAESRKSAAEWIENKGNLELTAFEMAWGPLKIEANGGLSLDENLQPLASFSGKLYGLESLIDVLRQSKWVDRKTASVAKLGLGLFKESDPLHPNQAYHRISFGMQNGSLSLGPINLMKVPPIPWGQESSSHNNLH